MRDYASNQSIFIDNVFLSDAQGINWDNETQDTLIHTIQDGLAGKATGRTDFKGHVEIVVPQEGLPYDIDKASIERRVVEIAIFVGDKSGTTKGWIENVKWDWSMDKPVSCAFDIVGSPLTLS